jgi:phosphoribosylglycinamide formyltransferase 1
VSASDCELTAPSAPPHGAAPKRLVVLISGRGSNMEALAEARLPAAISAVISNEPEAPGLAAARARGIRTLALAHRDFVDRSSFERALAQEIDRHAPDLIVLAGFMRLLTAEFVARYAGRLVNIHPSLLPAFPGLHTHRRALEAGVRIHGCTVHFVTAALDHGPIIVQAAVPVLPDDSEETLAARVLSQEHAIYPQAVRWFCEDRLEISPDGRVNIRRAARVAGSLVSPAVQP